jgi:branched-chain amino acid aminotransferase
VGLLDGITRKAIMRVARDLGLEMREEPLTLHDLYTSDECFATATRLEILPIVSIDGRRVGNGTTGPITAKIRRGFMDFANREGTPIY